MMDPSPAVDTIPPVQSIENFALDESDKDVAEQVFTAVKSALPEWSDVAKDDTVVSSIGGGITNKLFLLKHSSDDLRTVVRRFGDNTEVLIDRDVECSNTCQLNAYGFGARLKATFSNGRIEGFLDGYTLEPADMRHPLLVPRIAARIAEFHACNIQNLEKKPGLWTTISHMLSVAKGLEFEDSESAKVHKALDFDAMAAEIVKTQAMCDSTHSPVVFCHNDLLSGNMMLMGGSSNKSVEAMHDYPLQLIDFEYGCYSYRGYDWGNHFNEWAGFECEWDKLPTLEQQQAFLKAYLEAGTGRSVSPEQISMAVAEATAFAQASHIYWAVWAIIQARYSVIDFDYFTYSQERWQQYYRCKAAARAVVLAHFKPPVGESPSAPFPPAFPEAPAAEVPVEAPKPTVPVIHGEEVAPVPVVLSPKASPAKK